MNQRTNCHLIPHSTDVFRNEYDFAPNDQPAYLGSCSLTCAATVCDLVGKSLVMQAVLKPCSESPIAARSPAPPAPTTTASYVWSTTVYDDCTHPTREPKSIAAFSEPSHHITPRYRQTSKNRGIFANPSERPRITARSGERGAGSRGVPRPWRGAWRRRPWPWRRSGATSRVDLRPAGGGAGVVGFGFGRVEKERRWRRRRTQGGRGGRSFRLFSDSRAFDETDGFARALVGRFTVVPLDVYNNRFHSLCLLLFLA
jgi:hypothetical protein